MSLQLIGDISMLRYSPVSEIIISVFHWCDPMNSHVTLFNLQLIHTEIKAIETIIIGPNQTYSQMPAPSTNKGHWDGNALFPKCSWNRFSS